MMPSIYLCNVALPSWLMHYSIHTIVTTEGLFLFIIHININNPLTSQYSMFRLQHGSHTNRGVCCAARSCCRMTRRKLNNAVFQPLLQPVCGGRITNIWLLQNVHRSTFTASVRLCTCEKLTSKQCWRLLYHPPPTPDEHIAKHAHLTLNNYASAGIMHRKITWLLVSSIQIYLVKLKSFSKLKWEQQY